MISAATFLALAAATAAPNPDDGRPKEPKAKAQEQTVTDAAGRKLNISKAARAALAELQAAVDAKDAASIPAKLAAAQAVAQSTDEKYIVSQLQLKAAAAANDDAAIEAAVNAMLASGGAPQDQMQSLYLALARSQHKNQQYAKAASSFERVLQYNPSNTDALILLAETRKSQGQINDAVGLIQRAMAARQAGGQKADESWYKRAVGIAYEAKLPIAVDLSRKWVAAFPTPGNWRDALRIYRQLGDPDDAARLDALRLARATGALEGDTEFHMLAFIASESASPGEARAVIEEAIAAKQIDGSKPLFKSMLATLNANKAMSRAALPDLARDARTATAARLSVRTADAYYGYGDYPQAADLYRAALAKSGADRDLVNLHLGMALARAGDKAGATAALNLVTGPRSELAKFWLLYVATRP